MEKKLLVFRVDDGRFGIPATQVREVVRAVTITPVANLPSMVMGVINLRGRVIFVLDARRLLNSPDREMFHTDHLIVTEARGQLLALRVDRAVELVDAEDTDFRPADARSLSKDQQQFAKTSQGIVQLVDMKRVISDVEASLPDPGGFLIGSESAS